jgi:hypothetical protein
VRLSQRLQKMLDNPAFQKAYASRDLRKVMAFFTDEQLEELTAPFEAILRDVLIKGGRIGEKRVNDLTE